jgi:hypothetical protein
MMWKHGLLTGLFCACLLCVQDAWGADTCEVFDVGATDFEFYLGYDGIGLDKYEGALSGEVVAGYGFMDGFSGYISAAGESNEYFTTGSGGLAFGIFGTVVDTDHFDLDLFLNVGFTAEEFGLTPALELNFDLEPDLALWGIYLRVEQALAGRDESTEDDPATAGVDESRTKYTFASTTGLTVGTYYTVAENHQLLLEFDMAFANNPAAGEDTTELGRVALGYNVMLTDAIEMINQVSFDIPQSGEDFAMGVSTGIIVTMP